MNKKTALRDGIFKDLPHGTPLEALSERERETVTVNTPVTSA